MGKIRDLAVLFISGIQDIMPEVIQIQQMNPNLTHRYDGITLQFKVLQFLPIAFKIIFKLCYGNMGPLCSSF